MPHPALSGRRERHRRRGRWSRPSGHAGTTTRCRPATDPTRPRCTRDDRAAPPPPSASPSTVTTDVPSCSELALVAARDPSRRGRMPRPGPRSGRYHRRWPDRAPLHPQLRQRPCQQGLRDHQDIPRIPAPLFSFRQGMPEATLFQHLVVATGASELLVSRWCSPTWHSPLCECPWSFLVIGPSPPGDDVKSEIRTSVKKTSLKWASSVSSRRGRTSTPGLLMSMMNAVIAACFSALGSVRARSRPHWDS